MAKKYSIAHHKRPRKSDCTLRRCLCCGKPFHSAGPMNRLCWKCGREGLTSFTSLPRTWV